jgi:hypothetical protein
MTAKRGGSKSITSVMANVTVADFDRGLDWYQRFFGRPADRAQWAA